MSDFFTPTTVEIEKASGKNPTFASGDRVKLIIETVKCKEKEKGKMQILSTKVLTGEHEGRELAIFYYTYAARSLGEYVSLLQELFGVEQLKQLTDSGQWSDSRLVGKVFEATAKVDGDFTNWGEFKSDYGVPAIEADDTGEAPF